MTGIFPKIGDYVVLGMRYSTNQHYVLQVHSTTATGFRYVDRHTRQIRRTLLTNILYAGDERTANRLAAQLDSSMAQQNADNIAAGNRRQGRDLAFIENAKAGK